MAGLLSWGRYPCYPQTPHWVRWPEDVKAALGEIAALHRGRSLVYGCGRSYGDSCLAESDHVVATRGMDRLLSADWSTGVVHAQAGMTLDALIRLALPRGWFLPVTPGTKFVTLGGAVANDVHGKNHHVMGTFGRHVQRLVMYRTDRGIVECSPSISPDLFSATVGGLGLTGAILTVELQLRPVSSQNIEQRSIKFGGLDEFFALSESFDSMHEYTVAWIDCLSAGKSAGRGRYFMGNHADAGTLEVAPRKAFSMPVDPPFSLVNSLSLRAFNTLYYHRQRKQEATSLVGYDSFFYPLDGILNWNRMYGRSGFQQYQCVVPLQHGREVIRTMMNDIARNGAGSFLAVLKQCGDIRSPGILSFPMKGISLALDFPQRSSVNERLFERLDRLVHEAGGRLYPAKDAHMEARHFRAAYPHWRRVEELRDPQLLSKFWKRVTQ